MKERSIVQKEEVKLLPEVLVEDMPLLLSDKGNAREGANFSFEIHGEITAMSINQQVGNAKRTKRAGPPGFGSTALNSLAIHSLFII